MSLMYECHGGGCCGIVHISDFSSPQNRQKMSVGWLQSEVQEALDFLNDDENNPDNEDRVVEAVLIDEQLDDDGWAPILKEVGFQPVSRFYNSNSGNYCNVFHYHRSGLMPLSHVPGFGTEEPVQEAKPVLGGVDVIADEPVPVTVIQSVFHNRYRHGFGEGWLTLEDANNARGFQNRIGVVRRDHMSDGTVQEVELDNG